MTENIPPIPPAHNHRATRRRAVRPIPGNGRRTDRLSRYARRITRHTASSRSTHPIRISNTDSPVTGRRLAL